MLLCSTSMWCICDSLSLITIMIVIKPDTNLPHLQFLFVTRIYVSGPCFLNCFAVCSLVFGVQCFSSCGLTGSQTRNSTATQQFQSGQPSSVATVAIPSFSGHCSRNLGNVDQPAVTKKKNNLAMQPSLFSAQTGACFSSQTLRDKKYTRQPETFPLSRV